MKRQNPLKLIGLLMITLSLDAQAAPVMRAPRAPRPRTESAEGFHVGTGGDAIRCAPPVPGSHSPFNGLYSLDYVLTYANGNTDIARVRSLRESLARIGQILSGLPTLAKSFNDFMRTYKGSDPLLGKKWEPANDGLQDLKDEDMPVSLLPENCRTGDTPNIVQAVIRQYGSFSGTRQLIIYKYFPQVLDQLESPDPLQLSFLLVHEWLWDHSWNVDRNRRLVRFFHSREAERLSPAELRAHLEAYGLSIPGETPPVFEDAICPAEVNGKPLNNPLEALLQGAPSGRDLAFSRYDLFARKRNCDQGLCRTPWMVLQDFHRALLMGDMPIVNVYAFDERELQVEVRSGGTTQLNCKVVRKTGETQCDDLRTVRNLSFSLNSQHLRFRGIMTSECLRLTSTVSVTGLSEPSEIHYQVVLFGQRQRH